MAPLAPLFTINISGPDCNIFFIEATICYKNGTREDVPGYPVEVLNVLGAGDAFASGFIYGYLQGWDLYKACRMGNASGAWVVQKPGCANDMPYYNEAMQFIESRGGLVSEHSGSTEEKALTV